MQYTYENLQYEKRSITDNILIKVIGTDYQPVREKSNSYIEAASIIKAAEAVAQADSCPIVGREELRPILAALREHIAGLRIRHTQMGTAISTDSLSAISDEDAAFQIANGSTAHIAVNYDADSEAILLSHGILPILMKEPLEAGTYLFLEGVRETLLQGGGTLKAFLVKEHLVPTEAWIQPKDVAAFAAILQ
ncbi:MAG: hypothetical protein Q4D90_10125 [bacterium]|nr:hypothetical protein [bacterium]